MIKPLLLVFLLISAQNFAQGTERVEILGKINVPTYAEPAGITVYNLNSQQGTVTNDDGEFTIEVALNDSLSISSVQYQPFVVIVDQGIMDTRTLTVTVQEAVTELEKVIVRPYDLSGNVRVDVERVGDPLEVDMVGTEQLMRSDVYFPPDQATEVENIAMDDPFVKNGIQFVNIFKAIFLNDNKKTTSPEPKKDIEVQIREMYKDDFFKKYIDIDQEHIGEFIQYAKNNGLSYQLLRKGNELDLIEFLIAEGKNFKQQRNND